LPNFSEVMEYENEEEKETDPRWDVLKQIKFD
jgi:uncharacterized metal-binding protein YceD (DUF177 family)